MQNATPERSRKHQHQRKERNDEAKFAIRFTQETQLSTCHMDCKSWPHP